MFGLRIHGRGGQGVVTAAELVSVAAFFDGHEAQAIPSFGSERMGAPVTSYCRISTTPIRLREPVDAPDAVLVLDPTLLHRVDVTGGCHDRSYLLVNSARSAEELGLSALAAGISPDRIRTIPATDIARQVIGQPRANVCLLGALCALTAAFSKESLAKAVRLRLAGDVGELNLAAVEQSYAMISAAASA